MEPESGITTRDQILEAAYGLFLENGFHGTSMRQIASRARLSVAALYNHFTGKEPLYEAVLLARHPFKAFIPAFEAAQGETAERLLRDAARRIVDVLSRERQRLRLFFIEIVEFENRHIPALVDQVLPPLQQFVQRLYTLQPSLRAFSPAVIIRSFLGLFFSYYMSEIMFAPHLPKEPPERAFEAFIDIYLHGVLGTAQEE